MHAMSLPARYEDVTADTFLRGLWKENPVFVAVLGMCPMLAVTNSAINAVAMGGASFFVLVGSSFLVSTFRHLIPKQVRISCFIIIIPDCDYGSDGAFIFADCGVVPNPDAAQLADIAIASAKSCRLWMRKL